jgi:hypothetical protein
MARSSSFVATAPLLRDVTELAEDHERLLPERARLVEGTLAVREDRAVHEGLRMQGGVSAGRAFERPRENPPGLGQAAPDLPELAKRHRQTHLDLDFP